MVSKCVFYRKKHKAIGGPLKLNFEGLGMQRWNKPIDRAERVDIKKCIHLSSYQVSFQGYGY